MADDLGRTSSVLLRRLGNWGDSAAWAEFVERYSPLVRSSCGRFGLDAHATEDLCQQVWVELTRRLVSFRYDPGKSFRGWLRRFCHSRAVDLLRQKKSERHLRFDPLPPERGCSFLESDGLDLDAGDSPWRDRLLVLAAHVQDVVRAQVGRETWQAFWLIAVEDRSVKEAAELIGKSYAATFVAQKRVKQRLRLEGLRVLREARESRVGGITGERVALAE